MHDSYSWIPVKDGVLMISFVLGGMYLVNALNLFIHNIFIVVVLANRVK